MHPVRFAGFLLLSTMLAAPAFAGSAWVMPLRSRALPAMYGATPSAQRLSSTPTAGQTFTAIDAPGAGTGSGQGTWAVYVDDGGAAAGYYVDSSADAHAYFRAADGTFTTFDANGTLSQTMPQWMNQKDSIVGSYLDTSTGVHESFLRLASGTIETFDGETGGGSTDTYAVSVNDHNVVVGGWFDTNVVGHAFLRAKDGTVTDFDAPDSVYQTIAFDINDVGTVTGPYLDGNHVWHGFVRAADGTITEFDAPGAGTGYEQGTNPLGVNRQGWIGGYYTDSNNVNHGFLRDPSGNVTSYDTPDAGTGANQGTYGFALNGSRAMTGHYIDSANVVHGYERTRNGKIAEFDPPGSVATDPFAINRHDVIAGYDQDANGVFHGFLRTP